MHMLMVLPLLLHCIELRSRLSFNLSLVAQPWKGAM